MSSSTAEQYRAQIERVFGKSIERLMAREDEKKKQVQAQVEEIKNLFGDRVMMKPKEEKTDETQEEEMGESDNQKTQQKDRKTENDWINENFAQIISILEQRIKADSEQLHDQRILMLRRELTTKKKTIQLLETQNRQLEKEMKNQEEIFRLKEANLQMTLDGKNKLVGRFGTDVSDYVKELIQDKKNLEDTVERLEDQEEELQEEIENLKKELKEEKEKNQKMEKDLEEKEKELEELEEQLEEEEGKNELLKKEVDESKGHIQGLKELSSLKLVARFDASQIHQLADMIVAREAPQPSGSARLSRSRQLYCEILTENPDANRLMQLGDLVDLIWRGTTKEKVTKILHNLREHEKYKHLDGWSNTEELEKLLAEKAVKLEGKEVVVPGTVTEIISEERGVMRAPQN